MYVEPNLWLFTAASPMAQGRTLVTHGIHAWHSRMAFSSDTTLLGTTRELHVGLQVWYACLHVT